MRKDNQHFEDLQEISEGTCFDKEFPNFIADGEIYSISVLNEIAIIGDGEETTYFYDIVKKKLNQKLKINKDSINNILISNNKKLLLTTSIDGAVTIFDTKTFKVIKKIEVQEHEINWILFDDKSTLFAFGTETGSVWGFLVKNFTKIFEIKAHESSTTKGVLIDDQTELVTCGMDSKCIFYDLKERKISKIIDCGIGGFCCMEINKKNVVAAGTTDNQILFISHEKKKQIFCLELNEMENEFENEEEKCSIEVICYSRE